MSLSLSVSVVLASDGKIDQNLTLAAAKTELSKLAAQHETETATIGEVVLDLLTAQKGTPISMPALVSMSLSKLNVQPENFSYLSDRTADYIRSQAQGKDNERPDSLFVIAKGKGGGVSLRADMPVKEAK